jgi:hypothetical protein
MKTDIEKYRNRPMPEFGQYGAVAIIAGRWKGELAWYDDDEEVGYCVVYPTSLHDGSYALVRRTSLRVVPEQDVPVWMQERRPEYDMPRSLVGMIHK